MWKPITEAVKMWKAKMAAITLVDEPGRLLTNFSQLDKELEPTRGNWHLLKSETNLFSRFLIARN